MRNLPYLLDDPYIAVLLNLRKILSMVRRERQKRVRDYFVVDISNCNYAI